MNNYSKRPAPNGPKNKIDWSKEVAGSGRLAGKVIGKFFSYLLNILLTIMLVCFIAGIIVVTVFAVYVKNYIDPEVDLSLFSVSNSSQTTRVYYMDYTDRENRVGEMVELEDERIFGSENSIWVKYPDIPKNLVNAFVCIEDKRFWSHHGVDWLRTGFSAFNYIIPIKKAQGGSTITQQTIKNIYHEDDYTPQRKIQEILRALNLEKRLDKTQILEQYLNNIYLSQNCYGVQAAAYTYFNKDVSDLTLIECAAIASITNAPTKYDPVLNPEKQAERRNSILDLMLEQGYITKEEYDGAYGKELKLDYHGRAQQQTASTKSWYTDQVIVEVVAALQDKLGYTAANAWNYLYTGGLSIITLQDPEVQSVLEEVYLDENSFPKTNSDKQPQSSAVVVDPATGDVLGIVGARGEKTGDLLQNHATKSTRSPGSSIKPLSVYAPALEYGLITYGSVFDDTPVWFNYAEDDTAKTNPIAYPRNLPERYRGLTTVNVAVEHSINTIAVRIMKELTPERSFDFVKNKLGMHSFIESEEIAGGKTLTDKDIAPLALGAMSKGLTNLEITAAYQIFPNGGVYNKPRTWLQVLDADGKVVLDNTADSHVVISEQNASIMTKMLKKVVDTGTAKSCTLKNSVNVAGKTGTTSSDVDRYFIGYTPYYVCGIWFGYETPKSIGTNIAWNPTVHAWDLIMTKLHEKYINGATNGGTPLKTFTTADGVITAKYCKDSGKLATAACLADPRGNRIEEGYFTAATAPTEYCDCHVLVNYDKVTKAVACDKCPEANIIQVGLLKVDREFPANIKVEDAQYTWREVSDGTPMPDRDDVPFYIGLYPSGKYPGYSATDGKPVYNRYCHEHASLPDPEPEPEPEPPVDDTTDTSEPDTDAPVTDVTEPDTSGEDTSTDTESAADDAA